MQRLRSESKVVQLYNAKQNERNDYLSEVKKLGDELMGLSRRYGESARSALADLTYIVIGRDIMETIEAGYDSAEKRGEGEN